MVSPQGFPGPPQALSGLGDWLLVEGASAGDPVALGGLYSTAAQWATGDTELRLLSRCGNALRARRPPAIPVLFLRLRKEMQNRALMDLLAAAGSVRPATIFEAWSAFHRLRCTPSPALVPEPVQPFVGERVSDGTPDEGLHDLLRMTFRFPHWHDIGGDECVRVVPMGSLFTERGGQTSHFVFQWERLAPERRRDASFTYRVPVTENLVNHRVGADMLIPMVPTGVDPVSDAEVQQSLKLPIPEHQMDSGY